MAKILLVEDDNNLREIYEARLQAEGYAIVAAHDGEEALVVAKAEKPDLIISDVMMPKISGFEMLDILRNTDALKSVKVIMLTALGQSDDQQRANKLGADRYLVKSQVTLEDIVNVANELLKGSQAATDNPTAAPMPATTAIGSDATSQPPQTTDNAAPPTPVPAPEPPVVATPPPTPVSEPVSAPPAPEPVATVQQEAPVPAPTSIPVSTPPTDDSAATSQAEPASEEEEQVKSQIDNFIANTPDSTSFGAQSTRMPTPPSSDQTEESAQPSGSSPSSLPDTGEPVLTPVDTPSEEQQNSYSPQPAGKKVIEPLPDTEEKPDINTLLEKEKAKEIIESNVSQESTAPPTMAAADTAPTPSEPVIAPGSQTPVKDSVDPNSIAL